jgi:hypothetical protein
MQHHSLSAEINGLQVRVLPGSPLQTKHLIRSWVPQKKASPGTFPGSPSQGEHLSQCAWRAFKAAIGRSPRINGTWGQVDIPVLKYTLRACSGSDEEPGGNVFGVAGQ